LNEGCKLLTLTVTLVTHLVTLTPVPGLSKITRYHTTTASEVKQVSTAKMLGSQTQHHLKTLNNVCMCIHFEVNTI